MTANNREQLFHVSEPKIIFIIQAQGLAQGYLKLYSIAFAFALMFLVFNTATQI